MRILRILAIAMVPAFVVVAGCAGDSEPVAQEADATATIEFSVLENVTKTAAPAGLKVIKSKSDFTSFFGVAPPPEVNFNKQWVLHVSLGMRNSGGYSVDVTGVGKIPSGSKFKLTITAEEHKPGMDCLNTQAITNPQIAVVINKQPKIKAAELTTSVDVYSCTLDSCSDLGGEEEVETVFVEADDGFYCTDEVPHCLTNDHSACPQLTPLPPDWCPNGHAEKGAPNYISSADGMECWMPSHHCVTDDQDSCPQFSPRPPTFCQTGEVMQGAPSFIPSADGMECMIPSVYCVDASICGE